MKIPSDELSKIENETIIRYNKRYEKFGVEPKTLGWGSENDQNTRFNAAIGHLDFSGKSVLDIGCGFSDFYTVLKKKGIKVAHYHGIDINENLVTVSRNRYPRNTYEVKNILKDTKGPEIFDIVVLFGVLNFKLSNINNLEYSRQMIQAAWALAGKALVVDFLSTHRTPDYPKEDFVYYHDPKDVMDIALAFTNDFLMIHDYEPIPQKEFILVMKKRVSK